VSSQSLALFSMQPGASLRASGGADRRTLSLSGISLQTLSRILSNTPRAFDASVDEEGDDDDDGSDEPSYDTSFHRPMYCWFSPHTEPQNEGVELLLSGDFGRVGLKINTERKNLNITRSLLSRPHRSMPASCQEQYSNVNLLPFASFTSRLLIVRRISSQTQMGLLSPRTNLTFIQLNFQPVRTTNLSRCSPLPLLLDSSFYYTCAQGKTRSLTARVQLKFI
jgi:hypothetical protein